MIHETRHRPATGIAIRPFEARDYEPIVEIVNRNFPDYRDSVEEWRHADVHRAPKCRFARVTVEVERTVVAYGQYSQWESMYHPQKFAISMAVDPGWQRKGIGTAVYDHLVAALGPFDPILIRAHAREDYAHSVGFLERRGFEETMREWENRLRMDRFDDTPFADALEAVEAAGIRLASLGELRAESGWDRKLFDLYQAVIADVPADDARTPVDFERWMDGLLEHPGLMPDGYFVAVDGDAYVGLTNLWASEGEDDLYTGLTGVRRSHRRRGIALALKLAALRWAKAEGVPVVKTWNATTNTGMLAINEALGFERQPAWISYAREV